MLALGAIAARTPFATGFTAVIAVLALITLALPFLRERKVRAAAVCGAVAA